MNPNPPSEYRGRFAPSPTGKLHLGSLVSALASYLDAKAHEGVWLVRMEDIDPEKEEEGAARAILDCLEAHGFRPDGEVRWQSDNNRRYDAILKKLWMQKRLYACLCSRLKFQEYLKAGKKCDCFFSEFPPETPGAGWRLKVEANAKIRFADRFCGNISQNISTEVGDFILRRKDGHYAYQLAVVADDAAQNVSHVVRGQDLLEVTARQIHLQKLLGFSTPSYAHVPMVFGEDGKKLSKQNNAPVLENRRASENLMFACAHLGLSLRRSAKTPSEILRDAKQAWAENIRPGILPPAELNEILT